MSILGRSCRLALELIGRFAARAWLLCPLIWGQFWANSVIAADDRLASLNAEIQAIKAEVLVISEAMPSEGGKPENPESGAGAISLPPSSQDNGYLTQISRLQRRAAARPLSDDERLQLARLKLAFGLDVEAGFDLYSLEGDAVPPRDRSRAWFELADAYHRKGHYHAAEEALKHAASDLPEDLVGSYQLLQSNVLLALGRSEEAALSLQPWRGDTALAPYGYFNRAVALIRSGRNGDAREDLKAVIRARNKSAELAALRDRARLSLAYLLFHDGDSDRARDQLEAVREDGPYHSRAMMALSWIERQAGSTASALDSLAIVQQGSPSNPDVLESYLLVPALRSEDKDLARASRDYELAMRAYHEAQASVREARLEVLEGDVVSALMEGDESALESKAAQLLGPLLASSDLQIIQQDHDDLFAMLDVLQRRISGLSVPADPPSQTDGHAGTMAGLEPGEETTRRLPSPDADARDPGGDDRSGPGSGERQPYDGPWLYSSRQIPSLPQIELPPRGNLKSLPESQQSSPRAAMPVPVVEYDPWLKRPPDPTIRGMPDSTVIALPSSGEFFRRPGEEEVDDYAYPDHVSGTARFNRPRSRNMLPAPEASASFNRADMPADSALGAMALSLNSSTTRQQTDILPLDEALTAAEREEQLNRLRQQLLALQERIVTMMGRYEVYTRDLALTELERRQRFLAELEQQASLELAKTYDQLSQQ